jgi:hypothetical protein
MVTNPIYGSAYACGKTGAVTQYSGSAAGTKGRRKPRGEWLALKPGAQEGYLDWERAEAIRRMVSENIPTSCGRKLMVRYTGTKHNIPRYSCHRGLLDNGEPRCIAFDALRVDDAIETALLQVVGPRAIAAGNRGRHRGYRAPR